jgi:hypothetical protein
MEPDLRDAQTVALGQATTFGHDLMPWSVSRSALTSAASAGEASPSAPGTPARSRSWDPESKKSVREYQLAA